MKIKVQKRRDFVNGQLVYQINCLSESDPEAIDQLPCGLVALKWFFILIVSVFGIGGIALALLTLEQRYHIP